MEKSEISGGPKPHLVLYPFVGLGHLIPFVRLANRLVTCYTFSVTFITIKWNATDRLQTAYLEALVLSNPDIRVWELPYERLQGTNPNLFEFLEKSAGALEGCLKQLVEPHDSWPPACALIADFFHASALKICRKLSLPAHVFFASSAALLCLMLYTPKLVTQESFMNDADAAYHIPGIQRPIPRGDLPYPLSNKSSPVFDSFVRIFAGLQEAAGIMVNTFYELESHSLDALHSGRVVEGHQTPPIYPIGPILGVETADGDKVEGSTEGEGRECLEWLDGQPEGSVVYVCLGSLGCMSIQQTAEMALGLERSGLRFLWILRGVRPPTGGFFPSAEEPDLDAILPQGFRERVEERGLVVSSWAPQMGILSHRSVGGFVSHCGWNSTLEAVWFGVPMVAWPLYAEQQMNSVMVVNQWKVGLAVSKDDDGFVRREEVERVSREVMEGEEGRAARTNMKHLSELARSAIAEDGTSVRSLDAAVQNFGASE